MSDFDECLVCCCEYDLTDRIPMILPKCCHTICKICLDKISGSWDKRCPICREQYIFATHNIKPQQNRLLIQKLEKELYYQKCPIHKGEFLKAFCKEHRQKICVDCVCEDHHRGHQLYLVKELESKIIARQDYLEGMLLNRDRMWEKGQDLIKEKREEVMNQAKKMHEIQKLFTLETYLRRKSFIYNQESNLNYDYGLNSSFKKMIEDELVQYKASKVLALGVFLDYDSSEAKFKVDDRKFQTYFEDFRKGLDGIDFQYDLRPEMRALPGFTFLEIESHLKLELEGNTLIINATNELNKKTVVDIELWGEEVDAIEFKFEKFDFEEEDMMILNYVFMILRHQTETIHLIYLGLPGSKLKFEDHIIDFIKLVFSQPKCLTTIKITFIGSPGCDRTIRFLTEIVLPKAAHIKSLAITCQGSDLEDTSLISLIQAVNSLLEDLQDLSLSLSDISIKSKSIIPVELPNLDSFELNIAMKDASHKTWRGFFKKSLALMKRLRKCGISCKEFIGQDVNMIFDMLLNMPRLQELTINLPSIGVENSKYATFLQNLKSSAKELKTLSFKDKILHRIENL